MLTVCTLRMIQARKAWASRGHRDAAEPGPPQQRYRLQITNLSLDYVDAYLPDGEGEIIMRKSFGIGLRRLLSMIGTLLLLTGMAMGPASVSAQAQTLTSDLTGVPITYASPYELMPDLGYSDDILEMIVFQGEANLVAVGFIPASIDLSGARDILLDGFFSELASPITLDRGEYQGVSYSLDMTNADGQEFAIFSLFLNNRNDGYAQFSLFIAPPSLFVTTMQSAQNSITVDGTPLMDGVDAAVMGDLVTANIGTTGGSTTTSVTEVTNNVETPTPVTQQSTASDADIAAYLDAVTAEYNTADTALGTILATISGLNDGTVTSANATPILTEQSAVLSGVSDRAAAIAAPAGMDAFHQDFLDWAAVMTDAGDAWTAFAGGSIDSETYISSLENAISIHLSFGDALTAAEAGGTGTTDTPTQAPTEAVATDAAAVEDYLAAIADQRASFQTSMATFSTSLNVITDGVESADDSAAAQSTIDEANSWLTYGDTASQLKPPAGYEGVQAAYEDWANAVVALGNSWLGFAAQDGTTIDDVQANLDAVGTAETQLDVAIPTR